MRLLLFLAIAPLLNCLTVSLASLNFMCNSTVLFLTIDIFPSKSVIPFDLMSHWSFSVLYKTPNFSYTSSSSLNKYTYSLKEQRRCAGGAHWTCAALVSARPAHPGFAGHSNAWCCQAGTPGNLSRSRMSPGWSMPGGGGSSPGTVQGQKVNKPTNKLTNQSPNI